jgi:hypothetical protein
MNMNRLNWATYPVFAFALALLLVPGSVAFAQTQETPTREQWGRRENFLDGFKSEDFRIRFSFKCNFSKLFTF